MAEKTASVHVSRILAKCGRGRLGAGGGVQPQPSAARQALEFARQPSRAQLDVRTRTQAAAVADRLGLETKAPRSWVVRSVSAPEDDRSTSRWQSNGAQAGDRAHRTLLARKGRSRIKANFP
jgi:hypothetical protein